MSNATQADFPLPLADLGFRDGMKSSFRGAAHILSRPQLLLLCLAPWLLNFFVLLPICGWIFKLIILDWLWGFWPDQPSVWIAPLKPMVLFFLWGFWVCATLAAFLVLALITGAPFHDKMGEKIEAEKFRAHPELIADPMSVAEGIRHAIKEALQRVLFVLPAVLASLIIGFVPIIGPPIALLVDGFFAAYCLALDALSMPLDRRKTPLAKKRAWLREHRAFALGFGVPFIILPCAIFLAPPLAAAAGTLVYCDLVLEQKRKRIEERGEA